MHYCSFSLSLFEEGPIVALPKFFLGLNGQTIKKFIDDEDVFKACHIIVQFVLISGACR